MSEARMDIDAVPDGKGGHVFYINGVKVERWPEEFEAAREAFDKAVSDET